MSSRPPDSFPRNARVRTPPSDSGLGHIRLSFLGTAGSWPTKRRNTSGILVETARGGVLLDCGEGTVRQLDRGAIALDRIETVLVSHFHGDHFLGLPGLLQTMQMHGRTSAVHVYGPTGAALMLDRILHMGTPAVEFPVIAHELVSGRTVELPSFTIDTADAQHPVPAVAIRLTGTQPPYPSMVFSGDTAPCASVISLARDVDLLIHESTGAALIESQMNAWGHSTARQAATVAREARARALMLTHFSSRYEDVTPLLEEARAVYPATRAAEDLLTVTVTASGPRQAGTLSPMEPSPVGSTE